MRLIRVVARTGLETSIISNDRVPNLKPSILKRTRAAASHLRWGDDFRVDRADWNFTSDRRQIQRVGVLVMDREPPLLLIPRVLLDEHLVLIDKYVILE